MAQGFNKKGGLRETPIQASILDFLKMKGVFCYRNQKGIIPIRRGRAIVGQRKGDKFTNGMPDIVAIVDGVYVGIEVKTEDGVQSPDQKRWQKMIEEANGLYFLVHSWEELDGLMHRYLSPVYGQS